MAVSVSFASMQDLVISELSRIPRRSVLQLSLLAIISESATLLWWSFRLSLHLAAVAIAVLLILAGLAVAYATSMEMIEQPRSRRGLLLYIGVALLMAFPGLLGLGLLALSAVIGQDELILVAVGIVLAAVVILPMLVAWPLVQSVSPRLISPLEAFRRSRGMRWPLLLFAFIVSAVSRALPGTMQANSFPEALLSAGLNGVFSVGLSMLLIAVAVAAFRHAN